MTLACDVIIPALNEAANIPALFDRLDLARKGVGDHFLRYIVIADNGSTDGTPELAAARGAVVVRQPQRGYGAACAKAIQWIAASQDSAALPDVLLFMDADLSDDPAAIPTLLAPIMNGQADLVIGSRIKLAQMGALNFAQRLGNALACILIWAMTGRRYSDLGPFRALRWKTLQRLRMADRTWGWTVEMQMKAALLRIPTLEVDVPYRQRRGGRSKISGDLIGALRAAARIIMTIVRSWWRRQDVDI